MILVRSPPDWEVKMGFRTTRARVWSHAVGGEYCMKRMNSSPLTAMCNRVLVWRGGGGDDWVARVGTYVR
jgi:hypothetical protein